MPTKKWVVVVIQEGDLAPKGEEVTVFGWFATRDHAEAFKTEWLKSDKWTGVWLEVVPISPTVLPVTYWE